MAMCARMGRMGRLLSQLQTKTVCMGMEQQHRPTERQPTHLVIQVIRLRAGQQYSRRMLTMTLIVVSVRVASARHAQDRHPQSHCLQWALYLHLHPPSRTCSTIRCGAVRVHSVFFLKRL